MKKHIIISNISLVYIVYDEAYLSRIQSHVANIKTIAYELLIKFESYSLFVKKHDFAFAQSNNNRLHCHLRNQTIFFSNRRSVVCENLMVD